MVNLFLRNLGFTLVFALVWLIIWRLAGGELLLGGFWVLLFGLVCRRIEVSFRNAVEAKGGHAHSEGHLSSRLTGLMLGVLLAQVVLFALVVFYLDGGEKANKALFTLVGIAGSTSLLIPVFLYSRSKGWIYPLVSLLICAGLFVWWEVVRNLWPDELLLGPAIGMATFALSALLIRFAVHRAFLGHHAEGPG